MSRDISEIATDNSCLESGGRQMADPPLMMPGLKAKLQGVRQGSRSSLTEERSEYPILRAATDRHGTQKRQVSGKREKRGARKWKKLSEEGGPGQRWMRHKRQEQFVGCLFRGGSTDELEGADSPVLMAVGANDEDMVAKGYRKIKTVVDSGAEDTGTPPGVFPGKVMPSAMSRQGKAFRVANGGRLRNFGELKVAFRSNEGHACNIPMQIAEVTRPLIAASQLAEAGNDVILQKRRGE